MVQKVAEDVWHRQEGVWHVVKSVMGEGEDARTCLPAKYIPLASLLGNMSPWHADAVPECRPKTILV